MAGNTSENNLDWHLLSAAETLERLGASRDGLTTEEAARRIEEHGPNALVEQKREGALVKLLRQFTEFIILVLIGAAIIAGALGEWVDSAAILAIVVLNGVIGFLQEEKAEKVMAALKRMSAPEAKVRRDGSLKTVPARELVPGDVVAIEAGDNIPADCRILESVSLRVEEAALTGESHPVDKDPAALEDSIPLADRMNMAYSGTTAVYGRGRAVVVATGMNTEMGRIARMLQEVKPEPTPLQKRLAEFGHLLVYAAGGICGLIFLLGILRGEDTVEMFLTAVSLAVAAIPEGLPAVVTIVLALGIQRMVKRHALIRKLPSVETLGAATVIASDKTGTLTQNQMTVKKMYLGDGKVVSVSGTGYAPAGEFYEGSRQVDPGSDPVLREAIAAGLLCNGAELRDNGAEGWQVIGDPTEGALIVLAMKAGLTREDLTRGLREAGEIPFDSERKMMTIVFVDGDGTYHAYTKGAPEMVLDRCTHIAGGDSPAELTDADRETVLEKNEELSKAALRVLAVAYRRSTEPLDVHKVGSVESGLTFLGLAGMMDPPREEVFTAVEKARAAGILPIMITGDNRITATAIAAEIGTYREGDRAVTGDDLDRMEEGELERELARIKVYARVNPEHKLKVVKAWRKRGDVIAMTGDGVNDAPALKEADIGVAMGITGTDVSKEASDMVLTDDNFASIVAAVEEGRGIFDNIRKVVHFLLSCNVGEIFVLLAASLAGMPLPLLPVQILWTNLVTDGLPALGLAMEPVDPGVMDRPPRKKGEGFVTRTLLWIMLVQGLFIAAVTLGVYVLELYEWGSPLDKARTMAFTVLVFCQKFHVFNCRNLRGSVFRQGLLTNRTLNLAVVVIFASQVLLIYVPALQPVFKVTVLAPFDWLVVFAASIQPLLWMEAVKLFLKVEHQRHSQKA